MLPLNAVIDLSHHNASVDFKAVAGDGVLAVIGKATQGSGFADPTYTTHREGALGAGLLWGAYHFATGDDAIAQAEHFLDVVKPDAKTLLVLDLEANPQGASMSLEQARAFVTHVQSVTGRWPGLYGGSYIKHELGTAHDPVLSKCWFWLAQYGPTAVVPACWKTWTLWQHTDGALGIAPFEVAGVGRCDRNKFSGTSAALKTFWMNGPAT